MTIDDLVDASAKYHPCNDPNEVVLDHIFQE